MRMMRFSLRLLFLLALPAIVFANTPRPLCERPLPHGEARDDVNPRAPSVRADTTWFGDYQIIGGEYHARSSATLASVMWTFDRGNGPTNDPNRIFNGEGWKAVDLTAKDPPYFRAVDASLDLGPGVPPPIIDGAKSLWVGVDNPQARALCWPCGPGYGNNWCQRVVSPSLAYNGSGSVSLTFRYFNNSEPCFDGTQVYLKRADGTELFLNPYPAGQCGDEPSFDGGFTGWFGSYADPVTYDRTIAQGEIGEAQSVQLIIEFKSDGGYSDEDENYCTTYGPFGTDDIALSGGGIDASYDFENGLDGWTPVTCGSVGSQVDIADVGCYTLVDPCHCKLAGNIVEMHAGLCDDGTHPDRQHAWIESPICDVGNGADPHEIFMQYDMDADMPRENCTIFRRGWKYYPWTCPVTGEVGWSPRVGDNTQYWFPTPVCDTWRYSATPYDVPETAQKVIAILEIVHDCSAFAIQNPSDSNFSPLFDNIAVGTLPAIHAPMVAFENGTRFQDVGSYPSNAFDPRAVGPANVDFSKYLGQPDKPTLAGDTLTIAGPQPGSDPNKRWEARLWWCVARRAPFQSDRANGAVTRYKTWRDRVSDGKQIDRPYKPEFAFGWMDSVQNGSIPLRNKFLSAFREDDDDYVGEGNPENEMLWDDIFYPGTQIEYFVTSNYIGHPNELFYLPDTTGGFFHEFEILPGLRTANVPNCGGAGLGFCVYQSATLYIDAYNAGRCQLFIENALRTILNGLPACTEPLGCEIPHQRNWDRYDYLDAPS